MFFVFQDVPPDYETIGTIFGYALIVLSWILIIITFPFSMCVCLKVNSLLTVAEFGLVLLEIQLNSF